jgi:ferritin
MPTADRSMSRFVSLLHEQVGHEFAAHQQYIALAVWFDAHDLPRLAAHFYRQSIEERDHALMMVRYMLDRGLDVRVPGVESVRSDFDDVREPIRLALEQERTVTNQIEALFKAARDDSDFLGEQFVLWFLKEQVEEVAAMTTLLAIAERAGDDTGAPRVAGGGR